MLSSWTNFHFFDCLLWNLVCKALSYYPELRMYMYTEQSTTRLESRSRLKAHLVECSASIAAKIKEMKAPFVSRRGLLRRARNIKIQEMKFWTHSETFIRKRIRELTINVFHRYSHLFFSTHQCSTICFFFSVVYSIVVQTTFMQILITSPNRVINLHKCAFQC